MTHAIDSECTPKEETLHWLKVFAHTYMKQPRDSSSHLLHANEVVIDH